MNKEEIAKIVEEVLNQYAQGNCKRCLNLNEIPVGISNRHIHLSEEDLKALFGPGAQLEPLKDLSQPGQYASKQVIKVYGPKGAIDKVRVLGPTRPSTQVEVSLSDCRILGISAPVRDSGDLKGSASLRLEGPAGSVTIDETGIVAARHIHMHTDDAKRLGLKDRDKVCVKAPGERGVVFENVLVRVSDKFALEMHLDTDEANAAGLNNGDMVEIVK